MKKKLLVKRILSIIIAVALLVSAVPVSLAIQNLLVEETTSKIVREVTELREESVKHFLCEDGSYIAATYSAPVHYKENGEWKEIDNSLSLDRTTLSKSGKPTYTTKAGGLSVSVPQNFSDGQQIAAQNKGYEIRFGVNSSQNDVSLKTTASVVELETLSSNTELVNIKSVDNVITASTLDSNNIEAYNAERMTVDNQSSAVTYKEIMPDTDFEYIVTSNSIKENIVVYEPQSEYRYSFDMDFGELVPIVKEDNSIKLVEKNNTDETIFYITAPYMYDANNKESTDIEMSLVKKDDIYVMTLQANANWINAKERVFPIIIDPTVYMSFNDVFVMDGLLNANTTKTGLELRVGKNLTNITRTYIKPTIPSSIPAGSYINNAYLVFKEDYFYRGYAEKDIYFQVYDCYDVNHWSPDSITWNNQPYPNSANGHKNRHSPISSIICGMGKETYTFNIKSAVTRWLNGGVNNGLMLASSNETTKIQVDFHSSRALNSENHPQMYINYQVPSLSISNWETDNHAKESSLFTITTGSNWTAYSDVEWISLSSTSGSGCGTNKIIVTENTNTRERVGTVTVKTGDKIIGTISVTQFGLEPSLLIDKTSWNVYGENDTTEINITSNDKWNILINENWVSASMLEGEGNAVVTLEVSDNITEKRDTTIIIANETGEIQRPFKITQLDKTSSFFCKFDSEGNIIHKDSSEYNHLLAQWSMALSYAAYNPIAYQALPFIPSGFMQDPYDNETKTAKADLESMGFDATSYNYDGGYLGYAAHTIGHRKITITNNDNLTGDYNYDINGANTFVDDTDNLSFRDISVLKADSGSSFGNFAEPVGMDSGIVETVSESDSNSRTLIVISVRGSVTPLDWAMDLANQINLEILNFETGCQEIIASLNGYLSSNDDIEDNPIILVTGHSLGAAIANLVAHELNNGISSPDVYAYTFATPNTVNSANNDPIQYTNIFNILNNNDFVPHFPFDVLGNIWTRHGQDFHITMPLNIDWILGVDYAMLGIAGHGMPNYYEWLNNLPEELGKTAENITVDDLLELSEDYAVGLVAKLLKAKCPVTVTLYDNNGNIVAYESQQGGAVYPEITDAGIVSWITENGEKMFLIPYGSEAIDVHIEAYDYGTMNLTLEQPGIGEPLNTITYNNVDLYPDKEFLFEVSEEVLPEDTQLFVTENGEIVGEVTETDPHLKSVTIDHVEKDGQIVTYKTFVTDNTVTEIRYIYEDTVNNTTSTSYLTPELSVVEIIEDGDNLIWTRGDCYLVPGNYVYDVVVKSGDEWFTYENAFAVYITDDMAATNQEFYSSVQSQLSTNEVLQTSQVSDNEFVSESDIGNYEIPYIERDNSKQEIQIQ